MKVGSSLVKLHTPGQNMTLDRGTFEYYHKCGDSTGDDSVNIENHLIEDNQ